MGNSKFQPALGREAATGVFSRGCVEKEGLNLAPHKPWFPTAPPRREPLSVKDEAPRCLILFTSIAGRNYGKRPARAC